MTFNIRHALGLDDQIDLDRIIAFIAQMNADVVALQEVDRFMQRSGHADQAAEVAQGLQMDWRYAASLRHGRSEYGNAIFSKYPIIGNEVIYLPGDKERRSVLKLEIDTGDSDMGCMCVMTTHLGVSDRDRVRQVPLLISQLIRVNVPAVLMGDFNMESDHLLMKGIIDLGWHKLELDKHGSGTVIGGGTIDHIYVRDIAGEFNIYTIPTVASDHCPVVLEISQHMVY